MSPPVSLFRRGWDWRLWWFAHALGVMNTDVVSTTLIPSQRRSTMSVMPSREEVRQALVDLAAGRLSPSDAVAWAVPPMLANFQRPVDDVVWRGLARLAGATVPEHRGLPALSREELDAWVAEFDRQAAERPLA